MAELLAIGTVPGSVRPFRHDNTWWFFAEEITAAGEYYIEDVRIPVSKTGAPTGDCWVEIHSSREGTSATANGSANIIGQASDTVDVSTLTTSLALTTFTFSGTIPVVSEDDVFYIVLYADNTISATAYLNLGVEIAGYEQWHVESDLSWSDYGHAHFDMVCTINGEETVSLSDTLTEDVTVSEIIRHSTTVQTNYAYYLLGDDGDVYEYSDEFKSDAGVTITKQYITKNTDLTDQGASPSDIFKTVYSAKLFYKDLDSSVGVTLSISTDDGTTWESSPTGTKSLGTGSGQVKTATWNFPGGKSGQFFKFKLDSGSTTTRIQWLGLEIEYEEAGPHFLMA